MTHWFREGFGRLCEDWTELDRFLVGILQDRKGLSVSLGLRIGIIFVPAGVAHGSTSADLVSGC